MCIYIYDIYIYPYIYIHIYIYICIYIDRQKYICMHIHTLSTNSPLSHMLIHLSQYLCCLFARSRISLSMLFV